MDIRNKYGSKHVADIIGAEYCEILFRSIKRSANSIGCLLYQIKYESFFRSSLVKVPKNDFYTQNSKVAT